MHRFGLNGSDGPYCDDRCAAFFVSPVSSIATAAAPGVDRACHPFHPPGYLDKAPVSFHAEPFLIGPWAASAARTSVSAQMAANPLGRSRNSWADGDGCVCLCLDAGAAAAAGLKGLTVARLEASSGEDR